MIVPFYDPEWEEAERADEKPAYYWVYWEGSKALYIKKYKPSVMVLVKKRTGCEYYRVTGGEK